jgi:hypothetical protein
VAIKPLYRAKNHEEFCVLQDEHPQNDEMTVVADFVKRTAPGVWEVAYSGHVRRRDIELAGASISIPDKR